MGICYLNWVFATVASTHLCVFATLVSICCGSKYSPVSICYEKSVFATVANTDLSICYGNKYGGLVFATKSRYLLPLQIRIVGICYPCDVFAFKSNYLKS